jgi:hypothetical protein
VSARRGIGLAVIALSLWAAAASGAPAGDPRAVIDDLLVASGTKPKLIRAADRGQVWLVALGPSLGTRRLEKLREVAAETFDGAAMVRRAAE